MSSQPQLKRKASTEIADQGKPLAGSDFASGPAAIAKNFKKFFKSGTFTFIVGPEQERFNVHILALSDISKPLEAMMTNGKMEESIKKEAILADVDPSVFGDFIEFAYKGLCGISNNYRKIASSLFVPRCFRCHMCGKQTSGQHGTILQYPFCSSSCRSTYATQHARVNSNQSAQTLFQSPPRTGPTGWGQSSVAGRGGVGMNNGSASPQTSMFGNPSSAHVQSQASYTVYCVQDGTVVSRDCGSPHTLRCDSCVNQKYAKETLPYRTEPYSTVTEAYKCSPRFGLRKYGCTNATHLSLQLHITSHGPSAIDPTTPTTLLQHAKLYVLANRYLVADLPEICLHKLHAELVYIDINDTTIVEIIQLVLYTYENTPDHGDILKDGTVDKLRDLVMGFVVDRAASLVQYPDFRSQALLGAAGVPGADLMALTHAVPFP